MRRLRKLFKLSWRDRFVLLTTFILLGVIRLGLWLLPFRTLLKLLQRIYRRTVTRPQPLIPISKVVWAVNVSSYFMPGGAKCLARALTTQFLMNWHGHSPQLRIGVAKGESGKLEAHAWIEHQGIVVIGNLQDLSRFVPLPSFEGVRL